MPQVKILGSQIEQTTLDPNLFLPAQTGNAGKSLVTDGTVVSWGSPVTVNGSTFEYLVSTTTSPPPATGNIRYNNASQTASTLIYVHKNEASPVITLTNFYRTILPNTVMLIQSKTVPTQYQRWLITQVLEDINHFTWTVTMLDSNGAIFTNTQPVLMSYSFNGTGAISLDNLSDVQIVAPTTGQTLVYNGSISQWVNTSAVGALSLDDLSDVTIATPVLGNALVYDGVDWKNSPNWIYSTPDANMKALEFDRLKIESFTHASAPYSYVTLTVQPFGPNIGSELFIKSSLMQWNGAQGGVIQVYDNSDSSASINLNNGYITGLITSGASGEATSVDYVFEQDELRVSTSGDIIYGGINFTNPSAASPDDLTTIIYAKPDATSNPELQIFGGYWQTTFDNSPKTHGVRVGGSYIALESPDISMRLNGAQVGGRVVVAGITERGNAILGVEPPPVPDYVVSATGTTGVTIYSNGGAVPSPWIDLTNSLTINQAIPPSSGTVYFESLIENTGSKTGTFEIGVSLNGAAPISANTIDYNIGPAVKQIFANTAVNAALVPIGTTVKLQARVITSGNTFNLFARNTERPSLIKVTVNGSGGGGGVTSLGQLSDVSLTSPTAGQALVYDGSLWVNGAGGGGGSTSISALTDATTTHTVNIPFTQTWNLSSASASKFIIGSDLSSNIFSADANAGVVTVGVPDNGVFRVNSIGPAAFTITGGSLSYVNAGIDFRISFDGSFEINGQVGTSGQVLTSNGAAAPSWQTVSGGGGIPDAPVDGKSYLRKDAAWADIDTITITGGTY